MTQGLSHPAASSQPSPSATSQPPTEPSPATLTADDDNDPPPPPKPAPKLCGVCNTQPGKYKCPRPGCAMPYCSIPCHKSHKGNHPPDPPPAPSQPTAPPPQPTNKPDPKDPYQVLLDHAHVFDRLFKKYPSLPSALNSIQSQTLPPPPPAPGSTPSFLTGGNPRKRKEPPWSKDVGLRKGADALRKARTDPTDTGDGVREYCEVVLYLLSLGGDKGEVDRDGKEPRPLAERAVREVREEVWREERRVVESLLREEEG
ncbi:hypothetical protein B0T21DRAFT_379532 [Apiosordaria backusii]|uniref:C2H2-type domain-containing protein n=1 Tax=Apiosordaria backusii TaxID=314023 RepID=A0AA40K6A9_9PEZI|nr:hypothetical protein B0T21DRAFT_379532 [Apiosordaria backusii]